MAKSAALIETASGTFKICKSCKQPLPLSAFGLVKGYPRSECRACHSSISSARQKERRATEPGYRESHRLKSERWRKKNSHQVRANNIARYGITLDEFNVMFKEQSGKCKICSLKLIAVGGPQRNEKAHVDHCHTSGKVRGILCGQCNIMLGAAKDSPSTLKAAINYLKAVA